jgi:hypothetical protein
MCVFSFDLLLADVPLRYNVGASSGVMTKPWGPRQLLQRRRKFVKIDVYFPLPFPIEKRLAFPFRNEAL